MARAWFQEKQSGWFSKKDLKLKHLTLWWFCETCICKVPTKIAAATGYCCQP